MKDNLLNNLLDEKKFPYLNMSLEERNYYLNMIKCCKDIYNSNHKIGNSSTCDIIEMHLKKENDIVYFNGSLSIGDDKDTEYRCISGEIWSEKTNTVVVEMSVIRLKVKQGPEKYRVVDEFVLEDDKLFRKSYYNYEIKTIVEEIDNKEMKGRLK